MTDPLDYLLAAVLADPDDDLPRLAYADALEERGGKILGEESDDIVAGRIRYQVGDPSRWCRVFEGQFTFVERRGFFDEIECATSQWKAHGKRLVREHPITTVRLTDKEPLHAGGYWEWRSEGSGRHVLPSWLWRNSAFSWLVSVTDAVVPDRLIAALSDACLAWAKAPSRGSKKRAEKAPGQ